MRGPLQLAVHRDNGPRRRATRTASARNAEQRAEHYAITSWLRRGIPIHVVQRMAGHKHLSTTQRYVHHLKDDLEDAARRLGLGNMWATASAGTSSQTGQAA